VIDRDGNSLPAQLRDQLCGFLDRFAAIIVRLKISLSAGSSGANDCRAGFAQSCGDASTGATRRAGDYCYATAQCIAIVRKTV